MPGRIARILVCCMALFTPACAVSAAETVQEGVSGIAWTILAAGLDLAEIPLAVHGAQTAKPEAGGEPAAEAQGQSSVLALRIDPAGYEFTLHMASEEQAQLTMPALAKQHGLVAAVNASMYLPDNKTSTGYLRSATHINNPRIAEKFGAFFVAGPRKPGLPPARLVDRGAENWQQALDDYALVLQNYRLSNAQGKALWAPEAPAHSIAALSQDSSGHILFLLCSRPLPPVVFTAAVLRLPLRIRAMMYLEGGPQAALLVRAGSADGVWTGRRGIWSGNPDAGLPNVLGVRPRAGAPQ